MLQAHDRAFNQGWSGFDFRMAAASQSQEADDNLGKAFMKSAAADGSSGPRDLYNKTISSARMGIPDADGMIILSIGKVME